MSDISLNALLGDTDIYKIRIIPPESSAGAMKVMSRWTPSTIIQGFLTNSLSFSTQNTWEGLHNGLQVMKNMEEGAQKVETAANSVAGVSDDGSGQHIMQGITETIARWSGATKPSFAFNIMFVKLNPRVNLLNDVTTLLKGCLPADSSGDGILKGTMEAPYGYQTGITGDNPTTGDDGSYAALNDKKGTWTVQVGRWFRARGLVMNSATANFSQQVAPDGDPLFAEVQVTFETWRQIKAGELEDFFPTLGRGSRLI